MRKRAGARLRSATARPRRYGLAGIATPRPGAQAEILGQLQESEERFRVMADSAPVMLWMAGTDAECEYFNKPWLEFSGRELELERGTGWAEGVHFEDFEACMHTFLDSFVRREPFRMEYRLRRADGEYRWILDTGIPRYTPEGRFAGYVGSCIDITEIREAHQALARINTELEVRVARRTAQLRSSVEDLEQFASAISHDLQAPLRTISGYVERLATRYQGRLDADADCYIGFITDGAERMRQQIRDLLAYSRASRNPLAGREEIDCTALLEGVRQRLQAVIEQRGGQLDIAPLPTLRGYRVLLEMLFQNLIENGFKFCTGDAPRVRVSAERQGQAWCFAVADNGIGIAPENQEWLFGVFQRLHAEDAYPGTGIGLAICKKAVERHDGRIWVASAEGEGATFYFTVPDAPEPDDD